MGSARQIRITHIITGLHVGGAEKTLQKLVRFLPRTRNSTKRLSRLPRAAPSRLICKPTVRRSASSACNGEGSPRFNSRG